MPTVNKSFKVGNYLNVPHKTAPVSPQDGDIWTTVDGVYARINGVTVGPFGVGNIITVSDTAPSSPDVGDFWYNTLKLKTYIWYDNYWVEVSGQTFASGLIEQASSVFISSTPPSTVADKYVWFKDLGNGNYDILIEDGS